MADCKLAGASGSMGAGGVLRVGLGGIYDTYVLVEVMGKLPETREGWTEKGVIHSEGGKVKFYFTVGEFEGKPMELFMHMDESGSALDGAMDCWAIAFSMALQSEVSIERLCGKFIGQRFDPQGLTDSEQDRMALSVPDYVCGRIMRYYAGKGKA